MKIIMNTIMKIIISAILLVFIITLTCHYFNDTIIISSLNHRLIEKEKTRIILVDSKNNMLVDGVMGFNLSKNYFYGWSNLPSFKYFAVELNTNTVSEFKDQEFFDSFLFKKSIEALSMEDEITYWDIKSGGNSVYYNNDSANPDTINTEHKLR